MAALPPVPIKDMKGMPASFLDWLRLLQIIIGGTAGSIPWSNVNKSGSNLADLATKNHNDLANIQGGTSANYFHLKKALKGTKTFDFGTVNTVNTSTTTQTITGATTTNVVVVTPTSALVAGLLVYGYVSGADTVTLVCGNPTAGNIAAGSITYNILVMDN